MITIRVNHRAEIKQQSGNYSKRDEFARNKSGGRYSVFSARFKEKLEIVLISKIGISNARGYKTMFFTIWLLGALRTAS
ncbi:MAG: hypothetical protein C4291_13355 [Candidatus Dadabacteria bacterium]